MDRGAWWATVHKVTKGQTRLKRLSTDTGWKLGSTNFPSRSLELMITGDSLAFIPGPRILPPFIFSEEVKSLSRVWLFVTAWTVAYHVPLSMRFSRQEYWIGLPFLPPRDWTHVFCVSCLCRWILYHWASWKASFLDNSPLSVRSFANISPHLQLVFSIS